MIAQVFVGKVESIHDVPQSVRIHVTLSFDSLPGFHKTLSLEAPRTDAGHWLPGQVITMTIEPKATE